MKDDGIIAGLAVYDARCPVPQVQIHGHLDREEQDEFARKVLQLGKEVFLNSCLFDLSAQDGRGPTAELCQLAISPGLALERYDFSHPETGCHFAGRKLQFIGNCLLTGDRIEPYGH